jgi:hypothetical protein
MRRDQLGETACRDDRSRVAELRAHTADDPVHLAGEAVDES